MEKILIKSELCGTVCAVDSKSDAHRALICAALCRGRTEITVKSPNADITATARCLTSLGATVTREGDKYTVLGRAEGGGELFCGESGSTVRFLLPVAAALGKSTTFTGAGKLPQRPMLPLTEELRNKGCSISADLLPITVFGKLSGGRYVLTGDVSSQFVSGLLMALPLTDEPCEILMSSPLQSELYADMTVKTLLRFGVKWKKLLKEETVGFFGGYRLEKGADHSSFCTACAGKTAYDTYETRGSYTVEGDWSGASFFAVAGAIAGRVSVSGLDEKSLQPDKVIADVLRTAGATVSFENGVINVKKSEIKPFAVDVSQYPDIFPILSVLACAAKGETTLCGAGRLRIKESDRIETTASMIRSLGGRVEVGQDYLKVFGTGSLKGGTVDGAGDHRIVMSAAIASLICEGEVKITGSEAVNKSYPEFFEALDSVKMG